ncbi:MAG TPA: glycosyl hydrolase, partial [Terracidiphilus sp.]|nr:glycosyl hydrolase [Terracidiphilus sp.]
VMRKIHELVAAGATVVGQRPLRSPSLLDYPNADKEVQTLATDVWGDTDGVTKTEHSYGKGMLVWGLPLDEVLAKMNVHRDFDASQLLEHNIAWIHRHVGDTDLYFIANQKDSPEDITARFRVSGKAAEIWHPDTGAIEQAAYTIADGRTTVPLHLAERESVFVVFRHATAEPSRVLKQPVSKTVLTLHGPWTLSFEPNLGAPAKIQLKQLESWTDSTEEGVKYFSGTASYTKTIEAPQSWFHSVHSGSKMVLDLGAVKDLAEVSVNGKVLGILWKPPYRIDITGAFKPGANQIEIRVTNEWTNRQIGDRLLPVDKRILAAGPPGFARPPASAQRPRRVTSAPVVPRWRNDGLSPRIGGSSGGFSPLPQQPLESGLIGPVTVVSVADQD